MKHATKRTLVVMPTYNECENVAELTGRLLRSVPTVDLLVVDDNSPDGTGALVLNLAADNPRLNLLHRSTKEGLGAAYRAGFSWGLERDYDRLIEMDADGSHQPEQLERLLSALDDVDLVLGSRWIAGGSVVNWPLKRTLLSRAGSAYARIVLGLPIHDVTGGFRAFTADALRQIGYQNVLSQGYCFQIEMLWKAYSAGLRIAEVPITFVERVHGESKMSSAIVREAVLRVTLWGLLGLPARLAGRRRIAFAGASAARNGRG